MTTSPASRTIAHLDLDAFFVSVERILDPSLIGKPVLVGADEWGRGVVAAASYEARAFGIHSAMPMTEARRRCPHATLVRGHYEAYQDYSARFFAILHDTSPAVEPMSLDEAYVDLTGFERLYGPAHRTVASVRARVASELGLPLSAGIATTRVVAKVASEAAKPNGQLTVEAGDEARFLAPLPLRALPGIGKVTAGVLEGLGLRTLGDVQAVDPALLEAALGPAGGHLVARASGIDDTPVLARGRPRSISRETTYDRDVTQLARLQATVELFADHVSSQLRHQKLAARTVDVKYRITGFETFTAATTFSHPTQDRRSIADAALQLLATLRREHPQPVRLLGVGVSNLLEASDQLSLFAADADRHLRLASAVDSVRDRFGFGALMTGTALDLDDARVVKRSLHHPDGTRD